MDGRLEVYLSWLARETELSRGSFVTDPDDAGAVGRTAGATYGGLRAGATATVGGAGVVLVLLSSMGARYGAFVVVSDGARYGRGGGKLLMGRTSSYEAGAG